MCVTRRTNVIDIEELCSVECKEKEEGNVVYLYSQNSLRKRTWHRLTARERGHSLGKKIRTYKAQYRTASRTPFPEIS